MPMLSVTEHGRLVKAGTIPHPRSWSDATQDQMQYAHLARFAREKLRPYTTAEQNRQTNAEWVAYDAAKEATRWPDWEIKLGETVTVNGLASRPDLEYHTAKVVGVCFKTKRIWIKLDLSTERMNVLIERLAPHDDDQLVLLSGWCVTSLHI